MRHRPSVTYSIMAILIWPVLRGLYRLSATGLENLPNDGGFVLAANHTSSFDPWPLGIPLYPRRFLRFMAKSELFWPPLGWLIAGGGAFKVRRGEGDLQAMVTAEQLVRDGHVVVMFPEGTRRTKGLRKKREARAHTGAARIALAAGAPLVPAAITGTDRLARFRKIRVVFGAPLDIDDLRERPLKEVAQEATDRLMVVISELEESIS
jgi:1-acyl-sn-glycerol-3-phosphate acyltransferase